MGALYPNHIPRAYDNRYHYMLLNNTMFICCLITIIKGDILELVLISIKKLGISNYIPVGHFFVSSSLDVLVYSCLVYVLMA